MIRAHLSVAMGVGSSYGGGFDPQGVYRCTNDSGANQAVVIAGYSDAGGYWIVKNSWGATWNGDGYFKVGYGECAIETWVYYVETPASAPRPYAYATPQARRPSMRTATAFRTRSTTARSSTTQTSSTATAGAGPTGRKSMASGPATRRKTSWVTPATPMTTTTPCPTASEFDDSCPYRLVAESDGDTVLDGYEVATEANPCDPASMPMCTGGTDGDGDGFPDCMEHSGYNTCAFSGDPSPGYTSCAVPPTATATVAPTG